MSRVIKPAYKSPKKPAFPRFRADAKSRQCLDLTRCGPSDIVASFD